MGKSKRSSHTAESGHEKWMKNMKSTGPSPEANGYSCEHCGAACSTNNWLYHAMEPTRGVLCFYNIVNQSSHGDYTRFGISGYRGPQIEHTLNYSQEMKFLSGVGVKKSYDIGISKDSQSDAQNPKSPGTPNSIISEDSADRGFKSALNRFDKLIISSVRPNTYHDQDMLTSQAPFSQEIKSSPQSPIVILHDALDCSLDFSHRQSYSPNQDQVDGNCLEICEETALENYANKTDDAGQNNAKRNGIKKSVTVPQREMNLDTESFSNENSNENNNNKETDVISEFTKGGVAVCNDLEIPPGGASAVTDTISNLKQDGGQEGKEQSNQEDNKQSLEQTAEENDVTSDSSSSGSDNSDSDKDYSQFDEPDFPFKKRSYHIPWDTEDKCYFCIHCIMEKGTLKVKNEVKNICMQWGIQNIEK